MSNEMKDWLFDNQQEHKLLCKTVEQHTMFAAEQSDRVPLFGALYGSQNYGLATPESDVDTKVWLMPSFHDLYTAAKPYSKELHLGDAHVEGKDYRLMVGELKKQNMNFLETLFTPYYWVHPQCKAPFEFLKGYRESVARYDVKRGAHAFMGHMYNMYNRFKRDEKPKQVAHLMRLYDCLQRYALTDEPYEDLLFHPHSLEYLMAVRRGEVPVEELRDMAETYMGLANNLLEEMPEHEVNKDAEPAMNYFSRWVLDKRFKEF